MNGSNGDMKRAEAIIRFSTAIDDAAWRMSQMRNQLLDLAGAMRVFADTYHDMRFWALVWEPRLLPWITYVIVALVLLALTGLIGGGG